MLRTRTAGSLRASDIGQIVTLTGWVDRRRDHGGVAFIDLRDASGIAQVVIREEIAHDLRAEYVLAVTGEVSARPEGNANPNLPTGEIEVVVSDVEILNASAPLPFQVSDHAEDAGQVGEDEIGFSSAGVGAVVAGEDARCEGGGGATREEHGSSPGSSAVWVHH